MDTCQLVRNSKKSWINCHDSSLKYIEFRENNTTSHLKRKIKLEDELNTSSGTTFSEVEGSTDDLGFEHIRHQQHHNGIPVEGAYYSIHRKGNNILKANGEYHRIGQFANKTKLKEPEAYKKALNYTIAKYIGCKLLSDKRPIGELVILPIDDKYFLAYKFDIYTIEPLSRDYVYVDANSGSIIKSESRLRMSDITATAVTKYHGNKFIKTEKYNNVYRLKETSRGNGIQTHNLAGSISYMRAYDFTDNDNYWDLSINQDDAATSIHYSIEKTYDFFIGRFGRNSFDNRGGAVNSYVHYGIGSNGAFWDGDRLFFGDGDNINYKAFASTEVVAHEFTHAVTQYTANLAYTGESGALNESFSDIFGVAIDFYANPSTANFIIGDQVSIAGIGIRNLANPNQKKHPNTYKGNFWSFENAGSEGIHSNCGVQNYWFYLLCNGGSGTNDFGNFYNISSIGMDKAIAIVYRNLSVYLTSNSGYEDARFYSIQSAIDLYGECSSEVIAVTNAWYAVGVGGAFNSLVEAEFEVSQTSTCSLPLVVDFINKSLNASNFMWDFGDGNTSTLDNPSHIYTESGNYSVKLVATGTLLCKNSDTNVKSDLISIDSQNSIVSAFCQPNTNSPTGVGILNFALGNISNSSSLAKDEGGYIDFSCSAHTALIAGQKVPVSIITNTDNDESVRIWIDSNNDGIFSVEEKVFSSDAKTGLHAGYIIVPATTSYNTKLRLRVISDLSDIPIQSACFEIQAGQAEDYAVTIQPNIDAPVADFIPANQVNLIGDSVSFTSLCLNIPETFEWSFPGGTPSVSTLKNPKVIYATPGDYTVSLMVKNAYGENTKTVQGVVKVRNPLIMGSDINSSATEGLLYDSGGPNGKYSNNENSEFSINVPCVPEIRLTLQMLNLEADCDFIYIYEGLDKSGNLLYPANGVTKYDTIVAKSGKAFICFVSDGSTTKQGFALAWSSKETNNNAVKADFIIDRSTFSTNEIISFNNVSSDNTNNWLWSFGDGDISKSYDPTHWYNESGIKSITLIAGNCFSSDTIIKEITIVFQEISRLLIPDQVISLNKIKVLDLFDVNFNIVGTDCNISFVNSDNSVVQVAVNDNQLIINPLSLGEAELTINIINDKKIFADTFKVAVVDNFTEVQQTFTDKLKVYPNPVTERLFIELKNEFSNMFEISIYNLTGQLILNLLNANISGKDYIEIDVESLKSGLYVIELRENNFLYTGKFIRQ